jgi:hypothetical protein
MSILKCYINIIILISLLSCSVYSQEISYKDTLAVDNSKHLKIKPRMEYTVGSTFMFIPHHGSVTGFTITPSLSVPVSPHLTVNGGIIAGRYYNNLQYPLLEGSRNGTFNDISIFGSADYRVNSQLTFYAAGIKRLTVNSPYITLPNSSYTIGSTYKFGNFSIGVAMQVSQWNNNFNSMPMNGNQGFYSPFEQHQGIW